VAGLGSLLAIWRAGAPGATAAVAAYQTRQILVLGVGVLAIFLSAAGAARDRRRAAQEIVLAKPWGTARSLVTTRFIASLLSLATIAVIVLAAASLSQVLLGGTPWRAGPYFTALGLCVLPLALAVALGCCLATLFTTPLAAGVASVYWVAVPLARAHMPSVLDITPSQHWPLTAALTLALVALTAALYARRLRDRGPQDRWDIGAAVALVVVAGVAASALATSGDDGLVKDDPILISVAGQSAHLERRAPGFWLPNLEGRTVGLSDFSDRPVVIAFWGPAAPKSARALAALRDLALAHEDAGLACIAVCLDRDAAAFRSFSRDVGDRVVMVWDRGRHYGDSLEWSDSPLTVAYGVQEVPSAFLIDRERLLVEELRGDDRFDVLPAAVSRMVAQQ
jgi:peroxiredoxin